MECISCQKESTKSVNFPCPKCGEKILRCEKCRNLSTDYSCNKCGYKGP